MRSEDKAGMQPKDIAPFDKVKGRRRRGCGLTGEGHPTDREAGVHGEALCVEGCGGGGSKWIGGLVGNVGVY